jgi:hypothetical protein
LSNLFCVDENGVPVLNQCRYCNLNRGKRKIKVSCDWDFIAISNTTEKKDEVELNDNKDLQRCKCALSEIVLNHHIPNMFVPVSNSFHRDSFK